MNCGSLSQATEGERMKQYCTHWRERMNKKMNYCMHYEGRASKVMQAVKVIYFHTRQKSVDVHM